MLDWEENRTSLNLLFGQEDTRASQDPPPHTMRLSYHAIIAWPNVEKEPGFS